jgi:hypothetical protein
LGQTQFGLFWHVYSRTSEYPMWKCIFCYDIWLFCLRASSSPDDDDDDDSGSNLNYDDLVVYYRRTD